MFKASLGYGRPVEKKKKKKQKSKKDHWFEKNKHNGEVGWGGVGWGSRNAQCQILREEWTDLTLPCTQ